MSDYWSKAVIRQLAEVPLAVILKFKSDRLTRHAAALSFTSLLALAPMAALVLSVLSLFSNFEQIGIELENFIYQYFVPTAGDELRLYVQKFAAQVGQLTAIGLGLFLLTALMLLFTIEESFNDIWGLDRGRSLSTRLTVYWALVSLGPILMGASLTIYTYFLALTNDIGVTSVVPVQSWGLLILPFLFEMAAFLLLYLVMPNVRVSLVHALVGAVVASVLFELTKKMFSLYILNFNNYEVVYGALSTLPVLLIWIYLSWVVALIGAEVVSVLQQKKLL